MKKLLITGFDPFGGEKVNPSWEAVKSLPDVVGDFRLHKLQLPTVFGRGAQQLIEEAETFRPDVILCIGQAGGRAAVTPERVAINVRSANIPDNEGNQPREEAIVKGGADGLFATVPVANMTEAIKAVGLPAAISNTAGTFVCNELLYRLLHRYQGSTVRIGFVHVPYLPAQGTPNLLLEEMVKALTAAISAI